MEKFEKPEVFIDWAQKVSEAKETALSVGEVDRLKIEQTRITQDFLNGKISGKEFDSAYETLDRPEGVIRCATIGEYTECLVACGFSPQEVEETVSHEGAHFDEAVQKGLVPFFRIQVVGRVIINGRPQKWSFDPAIGVDFPPEMPDDMRRRILKEILEAPHDLSLLDKAQLGITDTVEGE